MVFSNLFFLYFFLPVALVLYYIGPKKARNFILLTVSLIFYAWGEPIYVYLMLFSILLNYLFGLLVSKSEKTVVRKTWLTLSILGNLAILGYYKYANFFVEVVNQWFGTAIELDKIPLPIGISFFTFQAISYIIDVYRKQVEVQRNVFDLALYIALFPQLMAGPIVRYNSIAEQIKTRTMSMDKFTDGIRRFILGLAKKVLISNPLGLLADSIFATSSGDLTTGTAWIGIFAYTLQIYFDFSGYSDMAIGLGKMFGFEFEENFRYPYISLSISEFWRRWHISLGNWFRDYLYFPLGGNRVKTWKIYRNLMIVWTVTGFWHGASWTFMFWGFYYGLIISLEKAFLMKWTNRLWKPLQHVYVMVLVMIGWVFFRADNFGYSFDYIASLFGFGAGGYDAQTLVFLVENALVLVVGIVLSTPLYPKVREFIQTNCMKGKVATVVFSTAGSLFYLALFCFVTMYLVNSTYNPFIYFRF